MPVDGARDRNNRDRLRACIPDQHRHVGTREEGHRIIQREPDIAEPLPALDRLGLYIREHFQEVIMRSASRAADPGVNRQQFKRGDRRGARANGLPVVSSPPRAPPE